MPKIIVASNNPVKINATLDGFKRMFPDEQWEAESVSVSSGVRDQPQSDEEAYSGAHNRAENASKKMPTADFWVGLEGGVEKKDGEMIAFAWAVAKSKDGMFGKGKTGTFVLPKRVAELVSEGKELGDADDIVFGDSNSKQKNGAVGILTHNIIVRAGFYADAVVLTLIPFRNSELYPKP